MAGLTASVNSPLSKPSERRSDLGVHDRRGNDNPADVLAHLAEHVDAQVARRPDAAGEDAVGGFVLALTTRLAQVKI